MRAVNASLLPLHVTMATMAEPTPVRAGDDENNGAIEPQSQIPSPILNYADPRVGRWVVIARFADEVTAHLAASKLDADGIETRLNNSLYFASGPTVMAVRAEDVDAAVDILRVGPAAPWLITKGG
jgi:hypothetical protein